MRRMIACLSLVLLMTSCGWFTQRAADGSHGLSSDEFEERAREVAEHWQGSADDRAWRLAAQLPPDSPDRADVRWPDGEVSQVPLITAERAYEKFGKPAISSKRSARPSDAGPSG